MKRKQYIEELRAKSSDELKKEARDISEEMLKMSFREVINGDAGDSRKKELRKNLARVYTLLSIADKKED